MNPLIQSVGRYQPQVTTFIRPQVSLEYLLAGNPKSQTILFVHGMGCNQKCFFPNLAAFEKDWQVLTLSLRGHGASAHPLLERDEAYTLDTFCQDILALLNHLKIEKVHYVGNSMGGLIGYDMVRNHVQRLLSLTTFGAPISIDVPDWFAKMGSNMLMGMSSLFGKSAFSTISASLQSHDREAYEFMKKEVFVETEFTTTHFTKMNLTHQSFLEDLKGIEIPFLIIRPEKDYLDYSIAPFIKPLLKNPNVKTVEIMGAGHLANLDRPREFEKVLGDFLNA